MPSSNITLPLNPLKHWFRNAFLQIIFPGAEWGKDSHINGFPRIWTVRKKQIRLGKNILLNSSPHCYHAGMAFPVTLIADRINASIDIGDNSRLHGCCIHAWSTITIGKRCLFAAGSQVIDANGHDSRLEYALYRLDSPDEPDPIWIDDDCWICLNAIILKGVKLGRGSIVTAGSIVLSGDYPPFSLLSGNPARVIRSIPQERANKFPGDNT